MYRVSILSIIMLFLFTNYRLGLEENARANNGSYLKAKTQNSAKDANEDGDRNDDQSIVRELLKLAKQRSSQGEYDESVLLYRASLSILKKVYGDRHPIICTITKKMVVELNNAGRAIETEKVVQCPQI